MLNKKLVITLELLAAQAPHAVLFEGVNGKSAQSEVQTCAELLQKRFNGTIRRLEKEKDKTVISIEQVQALYRNTRTKKASGQHDIWLLPAANTLSEPAQNAFLKLLEEPPEATHFILGTAKLSAILPTIRSRCQIVQAQPFETVAAKQWLADRYKFTDAEQSQLLFLAKGSLSELEHLADDSSYRTSQLEVAALAKQLISEKTYQKIAIIPKVAGNRERTEAMLSCALDMLVVMANHDSSKAGALEQLSRTYERILTNGNIRVQLLRVALQL